MKKIILICLMCLFIASISYATNTTPKPDVKKATTLVEHRFDITDPNVSFFYPKSDDGHVATAPFYFVQVIIDSDPSTKQGTAYWTPNPGDEGTYHVQFKATDSKGAIATRVVTLIVKPPLNRPPILYANR